jgi:membrane fusion protein (multidrug efflux system)
MIYRLSLLCCLLALAACDSPPEQGNNTPRGKQAVVIEASTAKVLDVARTIERNGSLRALRTVALSLQQEGRLLELPFHQGDRVSKGELLARLDDTLLRAQLKKAQAQRRQAELDLKRLKRLKNSRVVAEDELARAATALDVARAEEEALQISLQQTRILAPFDGTISARLAEPGDTVSRFSHLLSLIDTRSLTTELKLSELVIAGLAVGDKVTLSIDALGPQRFGGTIQRIHPLVDEASRQGTIEILLTPPPAGALPGQLCRVKLALRSSNRLLVPYNALRRDSRGEYLFVVNDTNKVVRRGVVSGLHFDEQVELLDGLTPGERIVTRGFLGLSEGSVVNVTAANSVKP